MVMNQISPWTNLVANAGKFTKGGAVSLSVSVAAGTLRVVVADTGIGIAPDKQELVFESFVQADSSTTREYGGTGLGLAICRRLARLMGGDVALESALGRGARFTLTLPDARFSARAVAPSARRTSTAPPPPA